MSHVRRQLELYGERIDIGLYRLVVIYKEPAFGKENNMEFVRLSVMPINYLKYAYGMKFCKH